MTTEAAQRLSSAEVALAAHDYHEATDLLTADGRAFRGQRDAAFSALLGEAAERTRLGDLDEAVLLLTRARSLSEHESFSDADRAEVLSRLGCCRLQLGQIPNAVELLTTALNLCDRSPEAGDRLRVEILSRRGRCYRRLREWEAARADADAAIELAEQLGDDGLVADAYFQASMVAERTGQLLLARFYVERTVELFQRNGRLVEAGKALNNLGGICFLLGQAEEARATLKQAVAIALQHDRDVDAAYAVSSTAQVLLRGGEPAEAERAARHALRLLGERRDHVNEIGNAQLVLGRALLEQGRLDEAEAALAQAEESFGCMDSLGHRAAAWLAQGDLAAHRKDFLTAATIYRLAADALQDVRF